MRAQEWEGVRAQSTQDTQAWVWEHNSTKVQRWGPVPDTCECKKFKWIRL